MTSYHALHHAEEEPSRAELIAAWTSDHGKAPPKGVSIRLLRLSAGYSAQAREFGDLEPRERHRLIGCLEDGIEARRSLNGATTTRARVEPGTLLVRNWKGRTHIVDVCEDHVVYDGKRFTSLTAVARTITGTNWSGPRFFGLPK